MSARRNRLDRLVAKKLGISRDRVRELLARRLIVVDGSIATDREVLVDGFSTIVVDGQTLQDLRPCYLMLHKPRGVLSATRDSVHQVATALIQHPAVHELHIAGRLDLHASGLLLLTNDGAWSRRLSAPQSRVCKQYLVTLRDPLTADYSEAFAAGIHFAFEDLVTRPARLDILDTRSARVTLQEGRYHQIKRMFGRFRNPVLSIHRVSIGRLQLDPALEPGQWRALEPEEIQAACAAGSLAVPLHPESVGPEAVGPESVGPVSDSPVSDSPVSDSPVSE